MSFAKSGNEKLRLLLLVMAAIVVEIFVLSGAMFSLLKTSAQWSLPLHLSVLVLPRFAVMTLLVAVMGPFQTRLWFGVFLALYAILLLVRFNQAEVIVEWTSAVGASRATLPYLAGFAGAICGFWLRRRAVGSFDASSAKPSLHA
jgi:hypothetical protein